MRSRVRSDAEHLRLPSDERREKLIDAAIRVFYRKGYRGSTIQDIADEMGFTGAAIYYYVRSKQDLLVEVIQEPSRRLIAMAQRIAATDNSPLEKVQRLFHEHLKIMLRDRELFSILLRDRIELPAEKIELLAQLDREYYSLVKSQISEAATAGQLDVKSVEVATLAVLGMVNWTLLWYREDGPLQDQEIADIFFDIFYSGTMPRASA